MTYLLTCPFCGGKANIYENEVDFITKWSVGCGDCNANLDVCEDEQQAAAEIWNTRAPLSGAPAQAGKDHSWKLEADALSVDVARLETDNAALQRDLALLITYGNWQIAEGPGHHPTFPSALAQADATLKRIVQGKPDSGAREATLKMVAGLFAESGHETYTREEIVSVVEDMIRLGRSPSVASTSQNTPPAGGSNV